MSASQSLTVTPGAQLTTQPAPTGSTLTLYIGSLKGAAGVSYQGGVSAYTNPGAPSPQLTLSGTSGTINLAWTTMQNAQASARVTIAGMPAHSWPASTPPPSAVWVPLPSTPPAYTAVNVPIGTPSAPVSTPAPPPNTASPIPTGSTNTGATLTTTSTTTAQSPATTPSSTGRTVALVAAGVGAAGLLTYGIWRYGKPKKSGERRR